MPANYDNSAWFYDRLSKLVFGHTLIEAHAAQLSYIPAHSNILIAGGGTGQLLEEIAKHHPSGLTIAYVELSKKMILLAKKRKAGSNNIIFINAPVEEAKLDPVFDVIITPFLLDSLSPAVLTNVFSALNKALKPGGLWLNTDFQLSGKWWQPLLLKGMYLFFKIIGCVEVTALPLIKKQFENANYRPVDERTFYRDFIVTTAYNK